MKLFKNIMITVVFFAFFIGCSTDTTNDTASNSNENVTFEVNYDYNFAKLKAEYHLINMSSVEKDWEGAEVGEGFYWYNPMTGDEPAYIEFKVMKNGKDQGYITVSLTESDYPIPEYHTEGVTTYEQLQGMAGTKDIRGTRFSPFDYMGEKKDRSSGNNRVFFGNLDYLNGTKASRGGDSEYDEFVKNYIERRREVGGIGGSRENLEEYYKMIAESKEYAEKQAATRGNVKPPYHSPIKSYIDNSDWIPRYYQFTIYDGSQLKGPALNSNRISYIGCTPTAGGMILAYWYKKHGMTNFFSKQPALTNEELKAHIDSGDETETSVIQKLAGGLYMKTDHKYAIKDDNGNFVKPGSGSTNLYNAWDGMWKYISDRGYYHWVIRWYNIDHDRYSPYWVNITYDWHEILKEFYDDRPPILHYETGFDGKESSGHSVVIYEIKLDRDEWTKQVHNAFCTVLMGWGDVRKTMSAGDQTFWEVLTIKMWK